MPRSHVSPRLSLSRTASRPVEIAASRSPMPRNAYARTTMAWSIDPGRCMERARARPSSASTTEPAGRPETHSTDARYVRSPGHHLDVGRLATDPGRLVEPRPGQRVLVLDERQDRVRQHSATARTRRRRARRDLLKQLIEDPANVAHRPLREPVDPEVGADGDPASASAGSSRQKPMAAHTFACSALTRWNASACRPSPAPATAARLMTQSRCRERSPRSVPLSRSRSRPNWRSGSRSRKRGPRAPSRRFTTDFSTRLPTRSAMVSSGSRSSAHTAETASSSNPPTKTDNRAHSRRSASLRS